MGKNMPREYSFPDREQAAQKSVTMPEAECSSLQGSNGGCFTCSDPSSPDGPPRRGCGGAGAASAPARRVPCQHQPGVPEGDGTLPNGAGGQGTAQLSHHPLLPCRCQDPSSCSSRSLPCPPSPSPCPLLHCHRKNLLSLAILLLLHQLMHLLHINRAPGARRGKEGSGVTHPAHDTSDSNTWRTWLAASVQQKAAVLERAAAGVSRNDFTTPRSLGVIKRRREDALGAIGEARTSGECLGF